MRKHSTCWSSNHAERLENAKGAYFVDYNAEFSRHKPPNFKPKPSESDPVVSRIYLQTKNNPKNERKVTPRRWKQF